jgi:2-aminoadipate transaminase
MFLWITGPVGLDGLQLLERAIKHQVAFVPGRDFFPADAGANYLRLNFSNSKPERIREGVRRLASLCR